MAVQRALISVFDKTGVVEFAKRLAAQKIEILSTGGTATSGYDGHRADREHRHRRTDDAEIGGEEFRERDGGD